MSGECNGAKSMQQDAPNYPVYAPVPLFRIGVASLGCGLYNRGILLAELPFDSSGRTEMNTVKTVVVTVVLMAVGYVVYISLWQKPDPASTDKTAESPGGPVVQLPGQESPSTPLPQTSAAANAPSVPPVGTLGSQAPLFGSNSRPMNNAPPAAQPPLGSANDRVTLIPGPAGEKPPTAPSIPAPVIAPPTADANPAPASGVAAAPDTFRANYLSFIKQVQAMLDEGRLPEALQSLTKFYEWPDVPEAERREVEQLLDQLAGTVIYSRKTFDGMEPLYTVRPGDTLDSIATSCNVPALLLARINGIEPQQLQPGQSLKILRGPFTAEISLDRHELTVKLQGGYYAGRFPIGVGVDCPKLEGTYTVQEKTPRPIYRGPDGVNYPGDDRQNPLGKFWIGLTDRIGLHGTIDETSIGRDGSRGTICLKDRDIDDLFAILSVGSQVVIRR